MPAHKNHLAEETSPYLLQHADNPVAWHPWNAAALELARRENKPILLSIGYSACHWCHVMAHESFEDEATAEIMNSLYVNIKIDREERPDLDKIYQTAQMLLTRRSGGWPLTMFLTPDSHVPFFGGTYFPNEQRHGLPAFKDLLVRVDQYYREHREEIDKQNASVVDALDRIYASEGQPVALSAEVLDTARNQLEHSFDDKHGGFGSAPKFPHPSNLDRLMRHWAASTAGEHQDQRALHIATYTLEKMTLGGVYDQLGGGFCRYSVDDYWMIPHFEKMLYDNGPLLALCSEAAVATGNPLFARISHETAQWVMREMQSPQGGYYSTLDADSEGEEGKFYVWQRDEVKALLDEKDYDIFAEHFGLDRPANFEGHWNLHVYKELDKLATQFKMSIDELCASLNRSRKILFAVREQRIRPGRDEKILTSWNGLMIKGIAAAGRHLDNPEYIQSAQRALDFIRDTLWQDNRLLATYKDGKAHLNAYIDDYAFLIDGIIELLQAAWRSQDLQFACQLADVLLDRFEDNDNGGFYFTSNDHEQLIQRPRVIADEATPAGNGIAATVLARLGYIMGETRYLDAAERTLKYASKAISESPMVHATLLNAFEEQLTAPQTIILRGNTPALAEWHQACTAPYAPRRISLAIPADAADLPPALAEKSARDSVVAYVCNGMTCSPPVTTLAELENILTETTASL